MKNDIETQDCIETRNHIESQKCIEISDIQQGEKRWQTELD